jgi:hypothetical protein
MQLTRVAFAAPFFAAALLVPAAQPAPSPEAQAKHIATFTSRAEPADFVLSPSGRTLVTHDSIGIRAWNAGTGKLRGSFGVVRTRGRTMSISPDDRWLATSLGGGVRVWDLATRKGVRNLAGKDEGYMLVNGITFSPDSAKVAAALGSFGGPAMVRVWDRASGKLLWEQRENGTHATAVAFSPDGATLGIGVDEGIVQRRVDTGALVRTLPWGEHALPRAIAFSSDGAHLAASVDQISKPPAVAVWETGSGKLLWVEVNLSGQLRFTADGRHLMAAGARAVHLLELRTGALAATVATQHPAPKTHGDCNIGGFATSAKPGVFAISVVTFNDELRPIERRLTSWKLGPVSTASYKESR